MDDVVDWVLDGHEPIWTTTTAAGELVVKCLCGERSTGMRARSRHVSEVTARRAREVAELGGLGAA